MSCVFRPSVETSIKNRHIKHIKVVISPSQLAQCLFPTLISSLLNLANRNPQIFFSSGTDIAPVGFEGCNHKRRRARLEKWKRNLCGSDLFK